MSTSRVTLIQYIQAVLTPDLLNQNYQWNPCAHRTTGHCYSASEALYLLLGGKKSGYTPVCLARSHSKSKSISHWWLIDPTGKVIDPTIEQFNQFPPYHLGKKTGFPSLRWQNGKQTTNCTATLEILKRIKNINFHEI